MAKKNEVKGTEEVKVVAPVETKEQKEAKEKATKKETQAKEREAKKLANASKKELHTTFINKLMEVAEQWNGVTRKDTSDYYGLRVGNRMFAEISASTKFGRLLIAPVVGEDVEGIWEGVVLPDTNGLKVRKVPESFGWTLRDIFEVTSEEQIEPMLKYLDLAYRNRYAIYEEKLAKIEEKLKKKNEKEAKEKAKKEEQTKKQTKSKQAETEQTEEQTQNQTQTEDQTVNQTEEQTVLDTK